MSPADRDQNQRAHQNQTVIPSKQTKKPKKIMHLYCIALFVQLRFLSYIYDPPIIIEKRVRRQKVKVAHCAFFSWIFIFK